MNIYIACSLTHVPREKFSEYTQFIHQLAAAVSNLNQSIEVTYALLNSDPQLATKPASERARLCYLWDRDMVEAADVVIAEASFPSIGLGIEMQIAEENDTPIILCFRDFLGNKADAVEYHNPDLSQHELQIGEGYVSLMALGVPSVFRVIKYKDSRDGVEKILREIAIIDRN